MLNGSKKALVRELQRVVGKRFVVHQPEDLLVFEYDAAVDRAMPEVAVPPRLY